MIAEERLPDGRAVIQGNAWPPYNPGTKVLPQVPNVSLIGSTVDAEAGEPVFTNHI